MELNKSVVRVNGRIDVAASLAKLGEALKEAQTAEETAFAGVRDAVFAVFAKHKGANINKPAVVSLAVAQMGDVPLEKMAETAELINTFIDQNKGENGLFLVKKGKNGGVSFRAHTAPETAKSEEA